MTCTAGIILSTGIGVICADTRFVFDGTKLPDAGTITIKLSGSDYINTIPNSRRKIRSTSNGWCVGTGSALFVLDCFREINRLDDANHIIMGELINKIGTNKEYQAEKSVIIALCCDSNNIYFIAMGIDIMSPPKYYFLTTPTGFPHNEFHKLENKLCLVVHENLETCIKVITEIFQEIHENSSNSVSNHIEFGITKKTKSGFEHGFFGQDNEVLLSDMWCLETENIEWKNNVRTR